MLYSYSFQPDGLWFVFCIASGQTIVRDLHTAYAARMFLAKNHLAA